MIQEQNLEFRKTEMFHFLEKLKCFNNSLYKFLLKNKKMLYLKKELQNSLYINHLGSECSLDEIDNIKKII